MLLFVYTLIRREDFLRCRFGGNYLKYLTQYSILRYHLYTRIRKKVWRIHHVHSLIKLNAETSRNDGVFIAALGIRKDGFPDPERRSCSPPKDPEGRAKMIRKDANIRRETI